MANIDEMNKAFIDKKVNPILEKMILDLLLKKPDSVCDFIMDWVKTQGRIIEKEIMEKKDDGKDRVPQFLISECLWRVFLRRE